VLWDVQAQPITMSAEQIEAFQSFFEEGDARGVPEWSCSAAAAEVGDPDQGGWLGLPDCIAG
jgi:hypothetical protein